LTKKSSNTLEKGKQEKPQVGEVPKRWKVGEKVRTWHRSSGAKKGRRGIMCPWETKSKGKNKPQVERGRNTKKTLTCPEKEGFVTDQGTE